MPLSMPLLTLLATLLTSATKNDNRNTNIAPVSYPTSSLFSLISRSYLTIMAVHCSSRLFDQTTIAPTEETAITIAVII